MGIYLFFGPLPFPSTMLMKAVIARDLENSLPRPRSMSKMNQDSCEGICFERKICLRWDSGLLFGQKWQISRQLCGLAEASLRIRG